jgi:hypothetical protein
MKRQEHYLGLTLIISVLLFYILTLLGCAPTKVKIYPKETRTEKISRGKPFAEKTYSETISEWKSYEDLLKWMESDFSFDLERYKKFEGTLPVPRTPEETFQLKSGIYIDAVEFSKKTLNQINPSYKAQTTVILVRPSVLNHYVCAFKRDGKIFILDYGTPYKEITGVHGPYNSLEEYKKFYEEHHPMKRKIEAITYLP